MALKLYTGRRRMDEALRESGLSTALRNLLDAHVPDGVKADLSVAGDESVVPPRGRGGVSG